MPLESLPSSFLHRRDHRRTGPLMAAREKAKRNKYLLATFCHDSPRLAVTAKEVIAGCFSPILQTLPFVQAQKAQYMYIYSLLYAFCTDGIILLVVSLCWSIHSSYKLVEELTGAENSYVCKLFFTRTWVKYYVQCQGLKPQLSLYTTERPVLLAWSSCAVSEEERTIPLWRNVYKPFDICLLHIHVELDTLVTKQLLEMIWGKTRIFQ